MADATRRRVTLEVPWRTILKLVVAATLVWVWLQITQLVLLLVVAVLLAVTLDPVVRRLEARGLARGASSTVVSFALLAVIVLFLWFTWSSLTDQAQYLMQHFSEIEGDVTRQLPQWLRQLLGSEGASLQARLAPYALRIARSAAAAVVVFVLAFILMLYLLIEGSRTREWLVAFVPGEQRARVDRTLSESQRVIFGYVAGNIATSIFATLFVLVALSILQVPIALLLAVLAGVCDFVPVLGFIVSAVPAVLLALTVSPRTALATILCYIAYHLAESYWIAPRVYGDRLKLSNVAVVLAFAVGAELGGVVGAAIALPLAAVYPAIERIWLRDRLPEETVREHRAIEKKKAG